MFFTVHIYQYRVEKNSKNAGGGNCFHHAKLYSRVVFIRCTKMLVLFNLFNVSCEIAVLTILFSFSPQSTEVVLGCI